jgi:hypothetical protein
MERGKALVWLISTDREPRRIATGRLQPFLDQRGNAERQLKVPLP